jgi:AP-3 complex subunit beta
VSARDLTLEAAQNASIRKQPTQPLGAPAIKKLLDSREDAKVLEGLRHVVGLFYANKPVLQYFTAVVKNAASANLQIKRLVYALLVQLAEVAPDTALLSINSIQRGLSDSDPKLRALALRTMSAVRVPVISQIVALGIKRGVADMSPIVRKTAAMAMIKCHRLDPSTAPALTEHLAVLLGDRQYVVVGAAVAAFMEICPERIDLIHPSYKSIIKQLVDMDEWGRLATLRMLVSYTRQCFPAKSGDPDLELLLQSSASLLQSSSAAVIVAVARLYLYVELEAHLVKAVGPLMALLRAPSDIRSLALETMVDVCKIQSSPFVPYAADFLLCGNDSPATTRGKLQMQSLLFSSISPAIRSLLLTDLAHCITSTSTSSSILQMALLTLGQCAATAPTPSLRSRCLQLLLAQLSSPDPILVGAALDEIRLLVQGNPKLLAKTVVVRLAKHLDGLTAPKARAAIVWLVGEFVAAKETVQIAADVWRILLQTFAEEDEVVQSQVLLLAAKVHLHHQQNTKDEDSEAELTRRLSDMLSHTFLLARYSTSFPLRDRARHLRALVLDTPSVALGVLLLLSDKPDPLASSDVGRGESGIGDGGRFAFASSTARGFDGSNTAGGRTLLGYSSRLLGVNVPGAPVIPAWTAVEVGKLARHGTTNTSQSTTIVSQSKSQISLPISSPETAKSSKTLEEWLDEDMNDQQNANSLGQTRNAVAGSSLQGQQAANQIAESDSSEFEESDDSESSGSYESSEEASSDEEST